MYAISLTDIARLQSGEFDEIIAGNFLYKIEDDLLVALPYDEDQELADYYDQQFSNCQELAYQ